MRGLTVTLVKPTVLAVNFAGAAGAAIDSLPYDGIAGTISGDDTVFVAMRNVAAAKKFTEDIGKLIT